MLAKRPCFILTYLHVTSHALTTLTRSHYIVLVVSLFLAANVCHAEQRPGQSSDDERAVAHERPERRSEPEASSEWYGLPFIFVDSYALVAMAAGTLANNQGLTLVGVFAGCLNGMGWHLSAYPAVPVSWLGLGKAVLSATLRLGLGGLACAAGSGCGELTGSAKLRLALGIGAGMLVDWLWLASRRVEPERHTRSWSFVPWAAPRSLGMELSRAF